jgi:hypothetical protein
LIEKIEIKASNNKIEDIEEIELINIKKINFDFENN